MSRPWITLCICTTIVLTSLCASRSQPPELLLSAHFDDHAAASWAVGSRAPAALNPTLKLVPGRLGNALHLPDRAQWVIIADDGNFRPDAGTVEMWVRPNWDGDDGQLHVLLNAFVARGNYLNIAKMADGTFGPATGGAGVGQYQRAATDVSAWEAGEWHHVAAAWGDEKLAFYLDGELVAERDGAIPPTSTMPTISIGGSWDGAIDELAIWSEPHTTFDLSAPIAAPELGEPEMKPLLPSPATDLDRYDFDLPAAERGYHVVPIDFGDEVDPAQPPSDLPDAPALSAFAAGGEWRTVAAVLYATADLTALTITPGELRSPGGAVIPASQIEVRLNRRAMQLPRPRVADEQRVPTATLLEPARPFDLPAGHFKEIAVTLRVPETTPAGEYAGALNISHEGAEAMALPLRLEILPFALAPSERKAFGMYYEMDLAPEERERVRAELQDIRDHHVTRLFSYLKLQHTLEGEEIVTSYDEVAEGLALLEEFGFHGEVIVMDEFREIGRLLGHENLEQGHDGASLADDERYAAACERAIHGLDPLRERHPSFEIVLTHMDEVMGRGRLDLFINIARPIRRVPEQRIYITMHTLPQEGVPEATAQLDPWMDLRCYNGHALDLYIQAGGSWEALEQELAAAGDEGWFYYNPHRSWFVAEWSRIINSLYFHASPLTVHCPYRYRTMRTWPLAFIHNMAYTVPSPEDFVTPISTRNWEGFRLGAQDCWYYCMLEDLVTQARERGIPCADAEAWLAELRATVPTTEEVQEVSRREYSDYPVVSKLADDMAGADFERIRRRTAEQIVALREKLR